MKKIATGIFVFLTFGFLLFTFYSYLVAPFAFPGEMTDDQLSPTETPIPEAHATFLIYTNGTKRVFTERRYHNRSSKSYITESDPTLIIVKTPGTTWREFFDSLPPPMKLTDECLMTGTGQNFCNTEKHQLSFYLNGVKVTSILDSPIQNSDELLVSFGDGQRINEQLQNF